MNHRASGLEEFYAAWSDKDRAAIEFDLAAAQRKAEAILCGLPATALEGISSVAEIGCGYGRFLSVLKERMGLSSAHGFDFSVDAVDFAQAHFAGPGIAFHRAASLDPASTAAQLREVSGSKIDCIALIDVLEHIPDAAAFVRALAAVCPLFLIKLPVESSLFDNYCTPKEYPGSRHSNGHVREFDANNVHYFVRELGLTPLAERLYVYAMTDSVPPPPAGTSVKGRVFRASVLVFKSAMRLVLPRKWFLRLVGGGGYYCVARFDPQFVLRP